LLSSVVARKAGKREMLGKVMVLNTKTLLLLKSLKSSVWRRVLA